MMQLKVRDILIGFPFGPQTQLATPRWGSAGDQRIEPGSHFFGGLGHREMMRMVYIHSVHGC
jgi:hypothetical protein